MRSECFGRAELEQDECTIIGQTREDGFIPV